MNEIIRIFNEWNSGDIESKHVKKSYMYDPILAFWFLIMVII